MPISWTKAYGAGRVFYTALGHREEVWQDARFQTHLLGAIRWGLGAS
jgi:type 1 glutamine amidotransferase